MACPNCSAVCAMPNVAITHTDGKTLVSMRCKHCNHQWKTEVTPGTDVTHMRSGVRLPLAKSPKVGS